MPVSANKYPIYNTVESIFVYGKKSADNSLSMSIVSEQKKSELDFDNDRTVISLNKISSSLNSGSSISSSDSSSSDSSSSFKLAVISASKALRIASPA